MIEHQSAAPMAVVESKSEDNNTSQINNNTKSNIFSTSFHYSDKIKNNTKTNANNNFASATCLKQFVKMINEQPSAKSQIDLDISLEQHHNEQKHRVHHHHQQQQPEHRHQNIESLSTAISSPKPNQVSTVLLYGIPIVSLYIESQERLCLAQISNTLLKQFSYNEIHNRRVALGITCVQCTPVQLEILRRAGAMPVSSRRCGMITRREAERLCKSFLGDNTPPRLPDDFAFSVHHKCAWGCRGSFLPSRYNSSRAKCIKCSFCGLFFSPNKFIFHSHRIGPGDKYVQPDAANFNSWRRHMKLSSNPPEEITYAWEDVKAMFNGGTRKRLMTTTSSCSSSSSSLKTSNITTPSARVVKNSISSSTSSSSSSSSITAGQSPKRLKETSPSRTNTINSHQVGQFAVRPSVPLNANHSVHQGSGSLVTNQLQSADMSLPFSRHIMMDYMWNSHAQTKNSSNNLHFSNYSLPWLKSNVGSLIYGNAVANQSSHVTSNTSHQDQALTISINSTVGSDQTVLMPIGKDTSSSLSKFVSSYSSDHQFQPSTAATAVLTDPKCISGLYNNSAFKPVVQLNRSASSYSAATTSLALETVAAVAAAAAAAATTSYKTVEKERTPFNTNHTKSLSFKTLSSQIKDAYSSEDDDEMVDIETTEEEEKPFDVKIGQKRIQKQTEDHDESLQDAPIEVENSSDELSWKGLKREPVASQQDNTFRNQTPTSSLISHSPASSFTSENHVSYQLSNKSASSTPDIILSASPVSLNSTSLNLQKTNTTERQRNVAAAIVSAFSYNQIHQTNKQQQHHHHHLHNLTQSYPKSHPYQQHSIEIHSTLPQPAVTTTITNGKSLASLAAEINSNTVFFEVVGNTSSSNKSAGNYLIDNNGNNTNTKTSSYLADDVSCHRDNLNDSTTKTVTAVSAATTTVSPTSHCVNNEFWSVAHLSFNRPHDNGQYYNSPLTATFQRHNHDITKHFQAFRNLGQETSTQTHGVG